MLKQIGYLIFHFCNYCVDKSLDHSDITSDSSGVGTCNSGGSGSSYDATPTDPALILPGMMVVCVENYTPTCPRHLKLAEGDIIEGSRVELITIQNINFISKK